MIHTLRKSLLRMTAVALLFLGLAAPLALATTSPVSAAAKDSIESGVKQVGGRENRTDLTKFIERIINVLLFIIGVIAVIMIIVGGLRYILSNGDQSQVSAAKNTILYSIVGLVVAIMAYAIVGFVIDSF